jgi:hypothetical protein
MNKRITRSNQPDWVASFSPTSQAHPLQIQQSQNRIGVGVSGIQRDGFRSGLQDGERAYLDSLGLGSPESIQDYFLITEEGTRGRVNRAVCVLYHNVLLLCRWHVESSLTSWGQTPGNNGLVAAGESEKLFVYGYLYPRHIYRVTSTPIGMAPFSLGWFDRQDFSSNVKEYG